jgi:hypothetical protein
MRLLLVVSSFSFGIARAQEQPPPGPTKTQQPPRLGRGGATFDSTATLDAMAQELTLDDQQHGQIKVLFDEHDKTMQELQAQIVQSPEDMAKLADLRKELETARQGGDRDQMIKMAEKFREFRKESDNKSMPIRAKMAEAREQLRTGIIGVLRDDQKKKFDAAWETHVTKTHRGYSGRLRNAQSLRAIVFRLRDMTSDQKTRIDEFFAQYKAMEGDPNNKPDVKAKAERKLYDDVLGALTTEQREKVESQLSGRPRARGPMLPGQGGAPEPPATSQPT